MIKPLKTKLFLVTIFSFLIFTLVCATKDIHAVDEFWNTLRLFVVLSGGLIFLFSLTWLIFKYFFSRIKWLAKIVFGLLWTPLFAVGLFIITNLSMCSFQPPMTGGHIVKIRNTRVFIDYVGDQGALGTSGMGVYQDAPYLGSENFIKTKLLCENEPNLEINFKVIDDHNVECVHESGRRDTIRLPM